MHTMWYLMHLSCFVLCHEVPSIRFPSANRLISSVFDDCMLQTVSLYVNVYSVRSSSSLEQSIRWRGHFLLSKQTHTEHRAGLVTMVPWPGYNYWHFGSGHPDGPLGRLFMDIRKAFPVWISLFLSKCFIDVCVKLLCLNISITCTQQFNHFDF